jgi:hypothetical protein
MAVPGHGLPGERSGGRLPHPNQRTPQGKVAAANSGHNLPPSPVGPLPCSPGRDGPIIVAACAADAVSSSRPCGISDLVNYKTPVNPLLLHTKPVLHWSHAVS